MRRRKNFNHTEEAFLLSTFSEFVKCWKSSKKSRLIIESVNGMAFMNFSVFLGNPSEVHSPPNPNPHPQRRPPSPKENKRKKSSRKIQRDNERAARYQENKRKELAAASAASGNPTAPLTSSKAQDKMRDEKQAPALTAGCDSPQTSSELLQLNSALHPL